MKPNRSPHLWLDNGRRLQAMFLTVAALLAATLLWMGWQLARQDRELAAQRLQERRESTADLLAAALQRAIFQTEEHLVKLASLPRTALPQSLELGEDTVTVVREGSTLDVHPANRLPFYPEAQPSPTPPASLFAAADGLEFRQADYPAAIAALQNLERANDPAVRASTLLRISRLQRKQGHWNEALATYAAMAKLDTTTVEGAPAPFVAAHSRMRIWEERKNPAAAQHEAKALASLIESRHYRLSRGVYEFYVGETRRLLQSSAPAGNNGPALALAAAVESLYHEWKTEQPSSGRRIFHESGHTTLALWRSAGNRTVALVAPTGWLHSQLDQRLRSALKTAGLSLALTGSEGNAVLGTLPTNASRQSVRMASATQLPWNLHVVGDPSALDESSDPRRRLLATALGIITLLILAGSYLIARAVTREAAVSRLQSDFVSAVSHEFRTPLTTFCLLSEQLASGKITNPGDQAEYFTVLAKESHRLRRLVEGLLNFGRMEAGAARYQFETVDPAELVAEVTGEFRKEGQGRPIEVHTNQGAPLILADRAALACAVWNLLDNAAKYSPASSAIEVDVAAEAGKAAIQIRDHGQGIPPGEQRRIFDKFVRGAAARTAGIQGTGVGLAMVHHIVSAHKGEIRLESAPGQGSSFTLLLPAVS